MLLKSTTAEADARARTVDVHGQSYVLREYIGNSPIRGTYVDGNEVNNNALPQGFLVTQPPGSVTPPHFHETNQFQVFVHGSGRLGKRSADPLSVQFAGGHTPYGPIVAGDRGIKYFTLRQRWDPGAKYMPKMRERLVRGRQRQRFAPRVSPEQMTSSQDLIAAEDDGLLARLIHAGAGREVLVPDASPGGGQYLVVVAGSLLHGRQEMNLWSCLYLTCDELGFASTAGVNGLSLLVLRFPKVGP